MSLREIPLFQALAVIASISTLVACAGQWSIAPKSKIDPPPTAVVLDMQRGRLLYDTHCVSCHTTQAHWREKSIVGAWSDVLAQVERWQSNTGLHWDSSEVGDVAAYLNAIYYKMPCSAPGCTGEANAALDRGLRLAKDD
ncbi:MAG: hypothetical protein ACT4PZ_12480 [Panacagrimonas sp.]